MLHSKAFEFLEQSEAIRYFEVWGSVDVVVSQPSFQRPAWTFLVGQSWKRSANRLRVDYWCMDEDPVSVEQGQIVRLIGSLADQSGGLVLQAFRLEEATIADAQAGNALGFQKEH